MFLKILVAAAAIAVVAYVGYFFWGEQQKASEETRLRTFQIARDDCLTKLDAMAEQPGNKELSYPVQGCLAGSLLTKDDLAESLRKHSR